MNSSLARIDILRKLINFSVSAPTPLDVSLFRILVCCHSPINRGQAERSEESSIYEVYRFFAALRMTVFLPFETAPEASKAVHPDGLGRRCQKYQIILSFCNFY